MQVFCSRLRVRAYIHKLARQCHLSLKRAVQLKFDQTKQILKKCLTRWVTSSEIQSFRVSPVWMILAELKIRDSEALVSQVREASNQMCQQAVGRPKPLPSPL